MSFYNMLNDVNPATFFILPMLGKHPDAYPRFRDCFVENGKFHICTRTGGGNREEYMEENQAIREMDGFELDFDDDFDRTYAIWVFGIPEKWETDFDKILNGDLKNVSDEYQSELKSVFPKLTDKFDEIFSA